MPKLLKFLAFHAGVGFALALASVLIILGLDIAHLHALIMGSEIKWIAIFSLVVLMTITLASIQMGIAVMRLPYQPEDDDRHGGTKIAVIDVLLRTHLLRFAPAKVRK